MRGKIKACDSCRIKKVKCDGNDPCKYCSNHGISCSFKDVPKTLSPYTKKKKKKSPLNHIVGIKTSSVTKNDELANRVSKIESLLEVLINRMNTGESQKYNELNTPISSESSDSSAPSTIFSEYDVEEVSPISCVSELNPSTEEKSLVATRCTGSMNSIFNSYDNMISGDYFSISSFSNNGLTWAANQLRDPQMVSPLKNVISNFIRLERSLLSVWVDPVDSSRLSSLPPKEVIHAYIEAFQGVCIFDLRFLDDVKELAFKYCTYKDDPNYLLNLGYGESLLLNTSILLGCTVYNEKMSMALPSNSYISIEQGKVYEKQLLDNALYYFHRISVLGDGLAGIEGLILFVFYADAYSVTQPLCSFTSFAVRHCQDLGLHRKEYYEGMNKIDREKALSVWWTSYVLDKGSALKTGRPPIIDDKYVTAPPLRYLEKYTNRFNTTEPRSALRRDEFHTEISKELGNKGLTPSRSRPFYFVMQIDLATIISRFYKNVLNQDFVKSSTETFAYTKSLLRDLENWRLCYPEDLRPGELPSKYIDCYQLDFGSIVKFLRFTDMNLNYYYLKLSMSISAVRSSTGYDQVRYGMQVLESAQKLLKFGIAVGKRCLQVAGFSLFAVFSAFVTIAAFCMQDTVCKTLNENVSLLIKACKEVFSTVTKTSYSPEKWILVGAVSRCVVYIVVNFVEQNNEGLHFEVGDLLKEVTEMQNSSTFSHLSSHFQEKMQPSVFNSSNNNNNSNTTVHSDTPDFNHSNERANAFNEFPYQSKLQATQKEVQTNVSPNTEIDRFMGMLEGILPSESEFIASSIFGESQPDITNHSFDFGTFETSNDLLGSGYSSNQFDDLLRVD